MSKPEYKIMVGDNRVSLRELAENSVDAIVTDPPYELGFMGKGWDKSGIANDVKFWDDCLRVLKPGGHLLAFSGSRTYHRMACAIEDSGFEVRDQMMWVYGSGFPKSLDVSKALDKTDGTTTQRERRLRFTAWVRSQGVTAKQINEATQTLMGSHYTTEGEQPSVMTREHLEACRHLFREVPRWVEQEADTRSVEIENFNSRQVIKTRIATDTTKVRIACSLESQGLQVTHKREINITAPANEAARKWDGWGTALKPAHEPIVLARKPLEGTVADNVLKWGTGALNIEGCRIGQTVETWPISRSRPSGHSNIYTGKMLGFPTKTVSGGNAPNGRWPANLMHDGSEEVLELFPESNGGAAPKKSNIPSGRHYEGGWGNVSNEERREFGSGSAARFFYCPKANKKDRNEGCEHLEAKLFQTSQPYGKGAEARAEGNAKGNKNNHPTVKPTELMAYLCRLVTPPGGLILDPFMGSGSTGKAAIREGFRFVGMELSQEYADIAAARIAHEASRRS